MEDGKTPSRRSTRRVKRRRLTDDRSWGHIVTKIRGTEASNPSATVEEKSVRTDMTDTAARLGAGSRPKLGEGKGWERMLNQLLVSQPPFTSIQRLELWVRIDTVSPSHTRGQEQNLTMNSCQL